MSVRSGLLLFAFAAIFLVSCGAGAPPADTGGTLAAAEPASNADVAMPPFPALHESAGLAEYLIDGISTHSRSSASSENGATLVLSGTEGGFAWAMYAFAPEDESLDSLNAAFDAPEGNAVWIALADYSTGRWDFSAALDKPQTIAVDSTRHISAQGNLYAAVIAEGGAATTVSALSIRTIRPDNQPPLAALDASPLSGNMPLDVGFDASGSTDSDGEIIEYAWDFNGDGLWESFSDGPTITYTFTEHGDFAVRMRAMDNELARSEILSVDIHVNSPVQAALSASNDFFNDGEGVQLTASDSADADGTIVSYEWDLDGDGEFSEPGAESQAEGMSNVYFSPTGQPGPYRVRVLIQDNDNAQDVAEAVLYKRGWHRVVIDEEGLVGLYPSLVEVLGRPGIAYFDPFNGFLKYAWSSSDGTGNWTIKRVDEGQVGSECSMAIIDGRPAISYYDSLNQTLKYAINPEADGLADWDCDGILAETQVGEMTSLAKINGMPAIAYRDGSAMNLRYAFSSTIDGSSGWQNVLVDGTTGSGLFCSLAEVGGRPAIAHHNGDISELVYSWSAEADGSSDWNSMTIDPSSGAGIRPCLRLINSRPAISYWNSLNHDLSYAWSSDPTGQLDWNSVPVLSGIGAFSSLAEIDDRPSLIYGGSGELLFSESLSFDGSAHWETTLIDDEGSPGFICSLAQIGGRTCVAQHELDSQDLVFHILFE